MTEEVLTVKTSPELITRTATGFMASKHLFIASQSGIFECLAGSSLTLDEISKSVHLPRRTARVIADSMVSLGFLEKNDNRYHNSPVAETYLTGKTPADLRPFLRFWDKLSYPLWGNFEEAVKTGTPIDPRKEITPEHSKIFAEGVEAITAAAAHALANNYDFSRHKQILDLGGGTGSFLMPILEKYHNIDNGILFELAKIAEVAKRRLSLIKNVSIVDGDFLRDNIPTGCDAIIVANVVHCLSPEHNKEVLAKLLTGAPKGARLLLVDFWTNPDHTQPVFAALMAGEFLLHMGEGDVYSFEEVKTWLKATGWTYVKDVPLAGPAGLIVAEKT